MAEAIRQGGAEPIERRADLSHGIPRRWGANGNVTEVLVRNHIDVGVEERNI
jgi:hypothetical protein